jgi:hypothetical protein
LLYDSFSSSYNIRAITLRKMKWASYVADMWCKQNAQRILVK